VSSDALTQASTTTDTTLRRVAVTSAVSDTATQTTERALYFYELLSSAATEIEFIETNATTQEPLVEEQSTNRTNATAGN